MYLCSYQNENSRGNLPVARLAFSPKQHRRGRHLRPFLHVRGLPGLALQGVVALEGEVGGGDGVPSGDERGVGGVAGAGGPSRPRQRHAAR